MILTSVLAMGAIGLAAATILAAAARWFYVPEDPRLAAIKAALPGINCGGCRFVGCDGAARAVLEGQALVNVCVSGGGEVAAALAKVMGVGLVASEACRPLVACQGERGLERRYVYAGLQDCRAEHFLGRGAAGCIQGCLGHGTCVRACPFDALRLNHERRPEVDLSRCRGCGRCEAVCPRDILRVSGLSARLLDVQRTDACLAPCQQKCPAQIDIPFFVRKVREKAYRHALESIKERNPFPMTCGRVCPHPCENICRRNIADEGVAVSQLERYVGEVELNSGRRYPVSCAPPTGLKVAVVGAGPAGLACAYFLRRLGHSPTIFEANVEPGGMLRYGIPEYRLPLKIVEWEVSGILELGVVFRNGVALGRDFDLPQLTVEGYRALFLATGAWSVPHMCVPGEYARGVGYSLDFLSAVGTRIKRLQGRRVVVIGESNTAMDCARSAIRLNAACVTVVSPAQRDDMSARKRDVERALEEGVEIVFGVRPGRLLENPAGRVCGVVCTASAPAAEDAGPADREPLQLAADLVIVAYERKPDLSCITGNGDGRFTITPNGTLGVDGDTQQAVAPHIFAAGDLCTGRATVISAVNGGRRAARSIHLFLTTGSVSVPPDLQRKINRHSILKNVVVNRPIPRLVARELSVEQRRRSFSEEVEAVIEDRQALTEAERCLRCGTLCYDRD